MSNPASILRIAILAMAATPVIAQQPGLYDLDSYRDFHITFKQTNWLSLLASNHRAKKDIEADLKVDGKTYLRVGVRYRGSSSYAAVPSTKKKSLNISIDSFVPEQRLMGYKSLNLSNAYNDPTFIREVVSYSMLRRYLPAPKANYVKVHVNGQFWGVYINVQQPNKDMMKEWFSSNDGNRYRCDPPTSAGNGKSNLGWLGTNLQAYKDAYELKTANPTQGWEDVRTVCNVLNNTTAARLPVELPKVLHVDRALWYIAVNNIFVNLDSYIYRGNDYYLYHDEKHDTLETMPWDMNESFGGYSARMSVARLKVLSPFYQASTVSRPLINKLLAIPQWRQRYIAHYRTLLDEAFDWARIGPMITKYQNLIRADILRDTRKIYSTAYFTQGLTQDLRLNSGLFRTTVPGLKPFIEDRRNYLIGLAEFKRAAPALSNLKITPANPGANDRVWVTAKATGSATIASVTLFHRVTGPYIAKQMFDDGKHGDGKPNDGVYGADIPPQPATTIVDHYVRAQTAAGQGGAMIFLPRRAQHQPQSYRVKWPSGPSAIKINEFMAKNTSVIKDANGEYDDWIELYNSSNKPVSVSGMRLTDNYSKPTKWKIPANQTLPAGGRLLIWCDEDAKQGPLHANFKLSGSGEEIGLFSSDGKTQLDGIEFGPQQADISTGRLADAETPWVTFPTPSPRQSNKPVGCGVYAYGARRLPSNRMLLGWTSAPKIGAPVTMTFKGGPKSSQILLFMASGGAHINLLPSLILLLGNGLNGPVLFPTNASGDFKLTFILPNDRLLVGRSLYMQGIGNDGQGFTASNALGITFCGK